MSEQGVMSWVLYMLGVNFLLFGLLFQIEAPTALHYACFFGGVTFLYAAGVAKGKESR